MKTLFGSSRLRALALNCSSVSWGKGKAEVEAKAAREAAAARRAAERALSAALPGAECGAARR